jgi:hypothetical protein
MSANDKKIKHYASKYQHWDLVAIIPLGYFEGCSTKYVTRWRKKDGLKDLDKAMHFLDKLLEFYPHRTAPPRNIPRSQIQYEVSQFAAANSLSIIEEEFILLLCNYRTDDDLRTARLILEDIIELAKEPNRPGTPNDGGHHATGQTDS